MPEVVRLAEGKTPPAKSNWVLVERSASGRFEVLVSDTGLEHGPFASDTGIVGLRYALSRATVEADRRGFTHVYVHHNAEA
jgi:hypothetical protein